MRQKTFTASPEIENEYLNKSTLIIIQTINKLYQ